MFKKIISIMCMFILFGCASGQLRPQEQYVTKSELAKILSSTEGRPSVESIEELMESSETGARAFTSYEGTGTGALGKVACTSLSTGDQAWVQTSTETAFFRFNSTDATAEDTTDKKYIHCYDASWTIGNWVLSSPRFLNFVVDSIGRVNPGTTPGMNYQDESADAAGETIITNDAITAGYGSTYIIKVDEDGTEDIEYIKADGVNEEIVISKPIDSSAAIEATQVDAGIKFTLLTESTLDLSASTVCKHIYILAGNANNSIEIELPDAPECAVDDTVISRDLLFINAETSAYTLTLDPDSDDKIMLLGDDSCGVGETVVCTSTDTVWSGIRLVARNPDNWIGIVEGAACVCNTP